MFLTSHWPKSLPKVFTDRAQILLPPRPKLTPAEAMDLRALHAARLRRAESQHLQCSALTGTWTECIFSNVADFTTLSSFTSEASLLGGTNQQPAFPALFFNDNRARGRAITVRGMGVLSSTGTPTYTFTFRLGTTAGSSYLSGTQVGVTAALTTQSGVTNKQFWFEFDLISRTPGLGSGNTTLAGAGYIGSPGGLASPFFYPIQPTTPDTATWTATIDSSSTYYMNISCACSASSGSNAITLKHLIVAGLN